MRRAICDIVLKHDAIGDVILSCGGGKVARFIASAFLVHNDQDYRGHKAFGQSNRLLQIDKKEGFDAFLHVSKAIGFDILEARKLVCRCMFGRSMMRTI